MLGPAWFRLPDGREIQPFAVAPWSDDTTPEHDRLPGLLRRLRGEWPCVPFGVASSRELPAEWTGGPAFDADRWPHGYGANHDWSLVARDDSRIEIVIDYPPDHPVRRLRRTVEGVPGKPQLSCSLEIEMRAAAELCLALHPVFRLPHQPRSAELVVRGLRAGRTYPVRGDATSRVQPDASFERLSAVPAEEGTRDLSLLPFAEPEEELLQVAADAGEVTLLNHAEGYAVSLTYDATLFPTVVLWMANGGNTAYPWNGRFQALGIEPARAAFDLGSEASLAANPWQRAGVPTAIALTPAGGLRTRYSIGAAAL
jgi:hypothetical protein